MADIYPPFGNYSARTVAQPVSGLVDGNPKNLSVAAGGDFGAIASASLNIQVSGLMVTNSYDFTAGLPAGVTVTRASPGTRINALGVRVTEAINAPRFDYDPATLALRGLLIEPQRTNLIITSDAALAPSGQNIDCTWVQNVAPDSTGVNNADKFSCATATNTSHLDAKTHNAVAALQPFTVSLLAAKGELQRVGLRGGFDGAAYRYHSTFDLVTLAMIDDSGRNPTLAMVPFGNNRYRVSASNTGVGTNAMTVFNIEIGNPPWTSQGAYQANAGDGVYMSDLQIEDGLGATSFIPTAGAAVTRSADIVSWQGPSGNWKFTFDDGSTQTVALVANAGVITVPNNLNRFCVRKAELV